MDRTEAVDNEQLIIEKICGATVWNTSFRNLVQITSNWQVEEFKWEISSSNSSSEICLKLDTVEEGSV